MVQWRRDSQCRDDGPRSADPRLDMCRADEQETLRSGGSRPGRGIPLSSSYPSLLQVLYAVGGHDGTCYLNSVER